MRAASIEPTTFGGMVRDKERSLKFKLLDYLAEAIRPSMGENDTNQKVAAESSLHEFVRQAWGVLEPMNRFVEGWHIGCIAEHLQAVNSLEIRNLIVNVPPRHSKSLLASVFWFVWTWIREPGSRWLYTSYAAHLSLRDSEKCRTLIRSPWFQARWGNVFQIKAAEDTKEKFVNTHHGYRVATSVGGVGTGEGGDYIVADDPHKTDEAISPAARIRVVNNWDHTMATRGNDPKTVRKVIIMQRLHDRDLTGHNLAENRGYQHLCLPAEYEPKRIWFGHDVMPRDAIAPTSLQCRRPELLDGPSGSGRVNEGDPLWPGRFGKMDLAKLKSDLGAIGWAGQGQQRPSPEEGTIFQKSMFRYFDESQSTAGLVLYFGVREEGQPHPSSCLASECVWFQCIDTAMTTGKMSAWTCVGTFALTPCRKLLVWDVWRERLLVPKQYQAIMELRQGRGVYDPTSMRWTTPGKASPWPVPLLYQAVENKASGIGLIQTAQIEGVPFRVLAAGTDKVRRSASLATMMESGCVYFRQAARSTWLTDYEDELLTFPGGAFADQVDVSSYAAIMATQDRITMMQSRIEGDLLVSGGGDVPLRAAERVPADDLFSDNVAWWQR